MGKREERRFPLQIRAESAILGGHPPPVCFSGTIPSCKLCATWGNCETIGAKDDRTDGDRRRRHRIPCRRHRSNSMETRGTDARRRWNSRRHISAVALRRALPLAGSACGIYCLRCRSITPAAETGDGTVCIRLELRLRRVHHQRRPTRAAWVRDHGPSSHRRATSGFHRSSARAGIGPWRECPLLRNSYPAAPEPRPNEGRGASNVSRGGAKMS